MGQLNGKIAIVTGATSGIGERIAEVFVAEGARVVAAGRRVEEGRALEARCGGALSFIRTDVADETSVMAMINHAVDRFGGLDCLVNNAGVGAPMIGIENVTTEQFATIFDTNVRGVMLAMKHAAPIMIAQRSGPIISIVSAASPAGWNFRKFLFWGQGGGHPALSQRCGGVGQQRCAAEYDLPLWHCDRLETGYLRIAKVGAHSVGLGLTFTVGLCPVRHSGQLLHEDWRAETQA